MVAGTILVWRASSHDTSSANVGILVVFSGAILEIAAAIWMAARASVEECVTIAALLLCVGGSAIVSYFLTVHRRGLWDWIGLDFIFLACSVSGLCILICLGLKFVIRLKRRPRSDGALRTT